MSSYIVNREEEFILVNRKQVANSTINMMRSLLVAYNVRDIKHRIKGLRFGSRVGLIEGDKI